MIHTAFSCSAVYIDVHTYIMYLLTYITYLLTHRSAWDNVDME